MPTSTNGAAIAACPPGETATGGGGAVPSANGVQVERSYPSNGTQTQAGYTAWEFEIRNNGAVPRNIRAYVICTKATNNDNSNYVPGVNPFN